MDAFRLISALLSMLSFLKLSYTSIVSGGLAKHIFNIAMVLKRALETLSQHDSI